MTSRKFAAIFLCISLVGAIPLLAAQSYQGVSAGLSAGFIHSLQEAPLIILFLACGLAAVLCSVAGTVFLPLSTVLLFIIGAGVEIGPQELGYLKPLMFIWLVTFSIAAYSLHNRRFVVFALIMGVPAFLMGGGYVFSMSDTLSVASYMAGTALSAILICGIGICIGITANEFMQRTVEKLKASPATSFLSWLL